MEYLANEMKMEFSASSSNEGFARVTVGAFVAELNPTVDELADIKTAVSEAVTNCIIHGYEQKEGSICAFSEKGKLSGGFLCRRCRSWQREKNSSRKAADC